MKGLIKSFQINPLIFHKNKNTIKKIFFYFPERSIFLGAKDLFFQGFIRKSSYKSISKNIP